MSYVPEEIRQAIARLNRIGQKNPVQVQFLIAENSIDENTIDTLAEKSKNINAIYGQTKEVNFVKTECKRCKRPTEMSKLTRVNNQPVCPECRKQWEFLL
jgi:SNF2 family DNA or RNA helicase